MAEETSSNARGFVIGLEGSPRQSCGRTGLPLVEHRHVLAGRRVQRELLGLLPEGLVALWAVDALPVINPRVHLA